MPNSETVQHSFKQTLILALLAFFICVVTFHIHSFNVSFYNNFLLSVEDSTPAVESVLSTFYQITQYPISLLNSVFKKDRDQTLNLTG